MASDNALLSPLPEPAPVAAAPVPRRAAFRSVGLRELFSVGLLVALADVTIFRGQGYAGLSVWMILSPMLLAVARPHFHARRSGVLLLGVMLLLLAARLAWLGSIFGVVWGAALLIAFSMALDGRLPFVGAWITYALHLFAAGAVGFCEYFLAARSTSPRVPRLAWINFLLPVIAVGLFGSLFVLANPDLVTAVREGSNRFFVWLSERLNIDFPLAETFFCGAAAWMAIALLRPILPRPTTITHDELAPKPVPAPAPLLGALRNTLLAVIVLFAVYLVFEFRTLWFREFPQGFYYAGYAHEGAAWLTAALALATAMLSAIFQGAVMNDPRLPQLKRLAWIWSVENLILAATVVNRMHIYIDFNGLTRMRMVGLFGISAVVVGFGLVIWKIVQRRDFAWLVSRQLWTVAIASYLFVLTPIDALVHTYNVRQIMSGDLAPAVQITEHPVNSEGVLVLEPLLDCEDSTIREGILALFAERAIAADKLAEQRFEAGWTAAQLSDQRLLTRLDACQADWEAFYLDAAKRNDAWQRFRKYAYQWY